MADRRWKRIKRDVARLVGGARIPVTGERHGADVASPLFAYQVKSRRTLPRWLWDWQNGQQNHREHPEAAWRRCPSARCARFALHLDGTSRPSSRPRAGTYPFLPDSPLSLFQRAEIVMLWLALYFHRLPLEVFTRGTPETIALAVASSCGQGAVIVALNQKSAERGVRCSMTVSAAQALASDLQIIVRDEAAERAALRRIAAWALQFTSVSSIAERSVLLEVERSLKLFGSLEKLDRRIRNGLADLGYEASLPVTHRLPIP